MKKKLLISSGLTRVQSEIYSFLLENGEFKASEIAKSIKRPRGVAYKGLDELLKMGFVEKIENEKITHFRAEHPGKLEKIFSEKEGKLKKQLIEEEENIKKEKEVFKKNLPDLVSLYNLSNNKPGIKFYEGLEGIKTVLWDTLTSTETIRAYSDIEGIAKYIRDLNFEYAEKREKLNIKKRGIIKDSPFSRNFLKDYYSEITENKFISSELFPFNSLLQIYDNKVAYITLEEKNMIGLIIEDKNIYQLHKSLFEDAWSHAKSFDQLEDFSNAK